MLMAVGCFWVGGLGGRMLPPANTRVVQKKLKHNYDRLNAKSAIICLL